MPELPEVETVMRGMEAVMLSKRVEAVQINRYDLRVPIPQEMRQMLTGQTVSAFTRRGKYIVLSLGEVHAILHLGMSGRIHIIDAKDKYLPQKHDHVVLTMADGTRVSFEDPRRFGMFYLAANDWREDKAFAKMGPEPLTGWSGDDLYKALQKKTANIKTALLDQRVVAGLGNIYVCEALYRAKVSPLRRSCDVNKKEAVALVKASKDVLEDAIKAGGSTLKDYKKTDGSLGYFQYKFATYDQKGQSCRDKSCAGVVERIVQAGRSTFFCPSCQK